MRFQAAKFYKPAAGGSDDESVALAPLIAQELEGDAGAADFGAVEVDDHGNARVDTSKPTVYFEFGETTIAETAYRQVTYVWWYEVRGEPTMPSLPAQGVRMTLDSEGFPLLWEILANDSPLRPVFVSRTTEEASRRRHGPAVSGRRFSAEFGDGARLAGSKTIVPRVLDDGPIPMGPWVYLSAETRAVTTILCRCMPSQVEEFVSDAYYDLRPLAELRGVVFSEPLAVLDELVGWDLEGSLRLGQPE